MKTVRTLFGSLNKWGNGTAIRLNQSVSNAAGFTRGTPVRLLVERGRIVLEKVEERSTLGRMLAALDPAVHGGEAIAFDPIGREVL